MLSPSTKTVSYVNRKGERTIFPLSSAMDSTNIEMVKRLKYTKDIFSNMMNLSDKAGPGGDHVKDTKNIGSAKQTTPASARQ